MNTLREFTWTRLSRLLSSMKNGHKLCLNTTRTLSSNNTNEQLEQPSNDTSELTEQEDFQQEPDFYPMESKVNHKPGKVKGEILFGIHPVRLAIEQNKRKIHKLLVKQGISNAQTSGILRLLNDRKYIKKIWVNKDTLDRLSGKRPHQGVCLDVDPLDVPDVTMDDVSFADKEKPPVWLILFQVHDPMNVGGIIRTSYFLGVDKVIISKHKGGGLTPVVSKASSGALEVINMSKCGQDNMKKLISLWKSEGGIVVGSASHHSRGSLKNKLVNVQDFKTDKPVLLLAGNEMKGIPDDFLSACDVILTIQPSEGVLQGIDSLNVAVATAITLHSIFSNRAGMKALPA